MAGRGLALLGRGIAGGGMRATIGPPLRAGAGGNRGFADEGGDSKAEEPKAGDAPTAAADTAPTPPGGAGAGGAAAGGEDRAGGAPRMAGRGVGAAGERPRRPQQEPGMGRGGGSPTGMASQILSRVPRGGGRGGGGRAPGDGGGRGPGGYRERSPSPRGDRGEPRMHRMPRREGQSPPRGGLGMGSGAGFAPAQSMRAEQQMRRRNDPSLAAFQDADSPARASRFRESKASRFAMSRQEPRLEAAQPDRRLRGMQMNPVSMKLEDLQVQRQITHFTNIELDPAWMIGLHVGEPPNMDPTNTTKKPQSILDDFKGPMMQILDIKSDVEWNKTTKEVMEDYEDWEDKQRRARNREGRSSMSIFEQRKALHDSVADLKDDPELGQFVTEAVNTLEKNPGWSWDAKNRFFGLMRKTATCSESKKLRARQEAMDGE